MQGARYNTDRDTQQPSEVALHEKAHIARINYQLKSGYAVTGTYIKRIGRRDSD